MRNHAPALYMLRNHAPALYMLRSSIQPTAHAQKRTRVVNKHLAVCGIALVALLPTIAMGPRSAEHPLQTAANIMQTTNALHDRFLDWPAVPAQRKLPGGA
jgi:hypothetical protein